MVNTLRPRQNGRHFPDDIFKWIFLNENVWISINISLKFVPKGPINNIQALVQIMAWHRPGDKPLSEPMMVKLSTHISVTRPQWVNTPVSNDLVLQGVWVSTSRTLTGHDGIFQCCYQKFYHMWLYHKPWTVSPVYHHQTHFFKVTYISNVFFFKMFITIFDEYNPWNRQFHS